MKSFKVAEFNAPLAEIDEPTPQPSGMQVLIKVKAKVTVQPPHGKSQTKALKTSFPVC